MSRIKNFLVVLLVITVSVVIHLTAVGVFPALQEDLAHPNGDTFNQEENMQDIYEAIAVWVPLIMDGGVIIWALAAEYQRQKDTALTVTGRPPR